MSSILATYAGSFGMLLISSLNYPGGEALNVLHTHLAHQTTLLPQNTTITIHLDVPVCMTGATRFLQEAPLFPAPETKIAPYQIPHRKYTFDKTENADTLLNPLFWTSIDYTLSSRGPEHVIGKWEVLTTIKGYRGIKIYSPGEKTDGGFHAQFKPFGIEVGSWWGMLEKEAREQYLQGMWVDVAMEDMVWILKKDGPIGRVDGGERGVGTIEEEHW